MIDDPVFCGLAVIFTFIFLLSVGSFFKIIPSLGDCVMRWKGNLDLEDSLQLSGSRNWMVMVLFVPLCMVVYSHGLYQPDYMESLPPALGLAATCGTMLAYLVLRSFLNWQLEMGLPDEDFHGGQPCLFQLHHNSFPDRVPCRGHTEYFSW